MSAISSHSDISESEQVEVSASKLKLLLDNQQELKEKHIEEVAKLKAEIRSKNNQLSLYDNAIKQLSGKVHKSVKNGENTKKVIDAISKMKTFDDWYENNKEKLIEEEYEKNYKFEVDKLTQKLSSIMNS